MQAASIIAVGTRPGRGVSIALVCAREHGGRHRPAFKLVRKLDRGGGGEERGGIAWFHVFARGTFAPLVFQPPRLPRRGGERSSNCLSEFDNGPSRPCKIHERARTL